MKPDAREVAGAARARGRSYANSFVMAVLHFDAAGGRKAGSLHLRTEGYSLDAGRRRYPQRTYAAFLHYVQIKICKCGPLNLC